jgi:pyrroloquinoline quinone biosynthesis protein B
MRGGRRLAGLAITLLASGGCGAAPRTDGVSGAAGFVGGSSCPECEPAPFVIVLGVAQDAGYPQAACRKACCEPAWADPSRRRLVSCLGIVDPATGDRWLVEATPDLPEQLRRLDAAAPPRDAADRSGPALAGVLLTHAHIGHYTGLVHLGREVTGASGVPVHVMPRMRAFLETNGPWSQLVALGNVELRTMSDGEPVRLGDSIEVTPIRVPHRDEFSETVGFRIAGPGGRVLFIPDIDKWWRWDRRLADELAQVDIAWLDGTFFEQGEIPGRDMSEIPHPFIEETLAELAGLPAAERAKVRFIHLNHTNPALDPGGAAVRTIRAAGSDVASPGERRSLGRPCPHVPAAS